MANFSRSVCPKPFIDELDYPFRAGYRDGRLCAKVAALGNAACCVPCPIQDWIYSDDFGRNVDIAFWISVPTLIFQIFLMLSFWFLPSKDGHGHYLNWGLTISVSLLALCMIVPLAAKPNICYDAITPNDTYTSQTCAWSGSLLLIGAMGIVSWIMIRSLYTHLRVVWGLELPRWYPLLSHAIGWGVPGLGLAISLPVTGVGFQVGPLCLLKKTASFATFFGWYLTFSAIAGAIQISTTTYCLWVFAKSFRDKPAQHSTELSTQTSVDEVMREKRQQVQTISGMYRKKHAWRRVKNVLILQWRSILLSVLVVASATYFGATYVVLSRTAQQQAYGPTDAPAVIEWATCLVINQGDKNACLDLANQLGLTEQAVTAAFIMLALTGIFTFAFLVRGSMFVGWYHVLRKPRQALREFRRRRSSIEENFVIVSNQTHHASHSLDSQRSPTDTGHGGKDVDGLGDDHDKDIAGRGSDDLGKAEAAHVRGS